MNRYPLWKYVVIVVALIIGTLYTLPNFFGEAPAVQVSPGKTAVRVDNDTVVRVELALQQAGLTADRVQFDGNSMKVRFNTTDAQLKARDVVEQTLNLDPTNPSYVVALNLVPRTPNWLSSLGGAPMYLGLDLRGGVHFMLQVDMDAALTQKLEATGGDIRTTLRDKGVRHSGIERRNQTLWVRARDRATLDAAQLAIRNAFPDLSVESAGTPTDLRLNVNLLPAAAAAVQSAALKQNITTLHNRINELGVAEPVIQQQGLDRIVVQLPGVQDTAKAKDILGRTATLEVRLVDESADGRAAERGQGNVPFGSERYL